LLLLVSCLRRPLRLSDENGDGGGLNRLRLCLNGGGDGDVVRNYYYRSHYHFYHGGGDASLVS